MINVRFVFLLFLIIFVTACATSGKNSPHFKTCRAIASGEIPIIGVTQDHVVSLIGNPNAVENVYVSQYGRSEIWVYGYEELNWAQQFTREVLVGSIRGAEAQENVRNNSPTQGRLVISLQNKIVQSFSADSY